MIVQHTDWSRVVLLLVLLIFLGCGPSKEQQAVDAFNRGVAHANKGEADFAMARELGYEPE